MSIHHFRLVLRRSQSRGPNPTFSLLVSAEMSSQFIGAARHYGLWNDIIYADPKLEEARELRARQSELKDKRRKQRTKAFLKAVDAPVAISMLPIYLAYKLLKLIYVGPFKLAWWLYCAFHTQNTQIMRMRELVPGKTITAHTLDEILESETTVQQSTQTIEAYIRDASAYSGDAFEPEPLG